MIYTLVEHKPPQALEH